MDLSRTRLRRLAVVAVLGGATVASGCEASRARLRQWLYAEAKERSAEAQEAEARLVARVDQLDRREATAAKLALFERCLERAAPAVADTWAALERRANARAGAADPSAAGAELDGASEDAPRSSLRAIDERDTGSCRKATLDGLGAAPFMPLLEAAVTRYTQTLLAYADASGALIASLEQGDVMGLDAQSLATLRADQLAAARAALEANRAAEAALRREYAPRARASAEAQLELLAQRRGTGPEYQLRAATLAGDALLAAATAAQTPATELRARLSALEAALTALRTAAAGDPPAVRAAFWFDQGLAALSAFEARAQRYVARAEAGRTATSRERAELQASWAQAERTAALVRFHFP